MCQPGRPDPAPAGQARPQAGGWPSRPDLPEPDPARPARRPGRTLVGTSAPHRLVASRFPL